MKKIITLLVLLCIAFAGNTATQVLSETVIPTENVRDVLKLPDGKLVMTYMQGKELTFASISRKEAERYWLCKQLGVKYQVVLQQLKTKRRIVIRC